MKFFNQYVLITIILSVLSVIVSVVSIALYQLTGAVYSITITSVISFLIYFVYLNSKGLIQIRDLLDFKSINSKLLKSILTIGFASLILGSAEQLSNIYNRSVLIKVLGIEKNGVYQSIYSISNNYFNILYMSIGIYLLPTLSAMKDIDKINNEINTMLRFILIILIPIISGILLFKEQIIIILFNSSFVDGQNLLPVNVIGDYFKAIAWIVGSWMIPLNNIKLWLILSLIFSANYVLIFYVCITFLQLDTYSIVISYAIAYFFHMSLTYFFSRRYKIVALTNENWFILVSSVIYLAVLVYLSLYFPFLAYFVIPLMIIIWLVMHIRKNEFIKIRTLLSEKMVKL